MVLAPQPQKQCSQQLQFRASTKHILGTQDHSKRHACQKRHCDAIVHLRAHCIATQIPDIPHLVSLLCTDQHANSLHAAHMHCTLLHALHTHQCMLTSSSITQPTLQLPASAHNTSCRVEQLQLSSGVICLAWCCSTARSARGGRPNPTRCCCTSLSVSSIVVRASC